MSLPDAEALYAALQQSTDRLRRMRRLTYRCQRRCLLLDAVEVGGDVLMHQKRYKYSPAVNLARSSEAGRANNTYDGEDHWKAHTYWIGTSALALDDDGGARLGLGSRLDLPCDHLLDFALKAPDFATDWSAGHAEVVVRGDGTRFAIH